MPKPTPSEQIEAAMLADIATETAAINGAKADGKAKPEVPALKMDARLARVHAGLSEMQAIAGERDDAIARAEKAEAEITNLLNLAEQRAEGERLRLKEVSDKAITEARAAVTQQEVLQGAIDDLRASKAALEAKVMEAQAEAAKYKTLAMMIRASIKEVLPNGD